MEIAERKGNRETISNYEKRNRWVFLFTPHCTQKQSTHIQETHYFLHADKSKKWLKELRTKFSQKKTVVLQIGARAFFFFPPLISFIHQPTCLITRPTPQHMKVEKRDREKQSGTVWKILANLLHELPILLFSPLKFAREGISATKSGFGFGTCLSTNQISREPQVKNSNFFNMWTWLQWPN